MSNVLLRNDCVRPEILKLWIASQKRVTKGVRSHDGCEVNKNDLIDLFEDTGIISKKKANFDRKRILINYCIIASFFFNFFYRNSNSAEFFVHYNNVYAKAYLFDHV